MEKLTLENQHLVGVLEALSNKNKELLQFKSKLEHERSIHKKTTQEKHELQEALNIAKGYQQTALNLEREKCEILKQLQGLKEQVSVANNALCSQRGNNKMVQEMKNLTQENRKLQEECALHQQEKRELKAQYMSQQSQPSASSRQSGMSAKSYTRGQRVSRLATIPDASPPVSQSAVPSSRMEAIDHTNTAKDPRHIDDAGASGEIEDFGILKKRKRHDGSGIKYGPPGAAGKIEFELTRARANDQETTPRSDRQRSVANDQPAGTFDLDPTLPCTFAESVDLTQMSDQTSPAGSIAAGTLGSSLRRYSSLGKTSNERKNESSRRFPVPLDSLGSSQEARDVVQEVQENTCQELNLRKQSNALGKEWKKRVDENLDVDITESDWQQELPDVRFDRMDIAPEETNLGGDNHRDLSNLPVRKGGFKYQEVVRRKADRDDLPGFDCADCKAFYDALATWGHVHEAPACGHAIKQGTAEKSPMHKSITHNTASTKVLPLKAEAFAVIGVNIQITGQDWALSFNSPSCRVHCHFNSFNAFIHFLSIGHMY